MQGPLPDSQGGVRCLARVGVQHRGEAHRKAVSPVLLWLIPELSAGWLLAPDMPRLEPQEPQFCYLPAT